MSLKIGLLQKVCNLVPTVCEAGPLKMTSGLFPISRFSMCLGNTNPTVCRIHTSVPRLISQAKKDKDKRIAKAGGSEGTDGETAVVEKRVR